MTRTRRLWLVFVLNAFLIIGLGIVGLRSHSLGVLAAAAEYIADGAAIGLTLFAHHLERRGVGEGSRQRPTEWIAFANAVLVIVVSSVVIVTAVHKLTTHTGEIHGLPACIASVVAMLVMGACALLLVGDDDLGVRAVLLDTAGDAAASGAVALSSGVIWLSGGRFQTVDSVFALIVSAVVVWHARKLLNDTIKALRS